MQSSISMTYTPKQIGDYFEACAKFWLVCQGFIIVKSNFTISKVGEIDIIAIRRKKQSFVLVFVEVRARKTSQYANASQSITKAKQQRLQITAEYFLQQYPIYANLPCQFDVISVNYDEQNNTRVEWLQNVF